MIRLRKQIIEYLQHTTILQINGIARPTDFTFKQMILSAGKLMVPND